jgi:hypothetical protein
MFIASSITDERTLLVLGLSAENRRRLVEGHAIWIERASHGLAIPEQLKIVIFTGETEETMRDAMQALIGPTTVIDQRQPQ